MARWLTRTAPRASRSARAGVLGLQLVIVPLAAAEFGREFPELRALIVPFGVAAVAAGVFVQLGLLCIARLAVLARGDRIFDPRAFAWVRGLNGLHRGRCARGGRGVRDPVASGSEATRPSSRSP